MSKIISHAPTPEYRNGWTRAFGTGRRNRTVHVSELLDEAMKGIHAQFDNVPEEKPESENK